jgi:cytochrome bd ubiquinol oxidase subunit I
MEAHWDGSKPGDFHIFAWPDEKANETNRFAISIPRGASLVLTHDPNGLFPGLKRAAERAPAGADRVLRLPHHAGDRPFHDPAAWVGAFLWWRGRLFSTNWYPARWRMTWWIGFVAVIAGWVVTESGRQPWLVHGILRTADAISPVPAASVATLALFVIVVWHRVLDGHLLHQPADREGAAAGRSVPEHGIAEPARCPARTTPGARACN